METIVNDKLINEQKPTSRGEYPVTTDLAFAMASWVMHSNPETVLDANVVDGTLLGACSLYSVSKNTDLVGMTSSLDNLAGAEAQLPKTITLLSNDYLREPALQFDAIAAIAPTTVSSKAPVTATEWKTTGSALNGSFSYSANVSCLYLAKVMRDLTDNGYAAIVMCGKFMLSKYGISLKEYIKNTKHVAAIIVLENNYKKFAVKRNSTAIVLIRKTGENDGVIVSSRSNAETKEIIDRLRLSTPLDGFTYRKISELNPSSKWSYLPDSSASVPAEYAHSIKDYFECWRGAITRRNSYYCLTLSDLEAKSIPVDNVELYICNTVNKLVFTETDLIELVDKNKRCFLFNPQAMDEGTEAYLAHGVKLGLPDKKKPSPNTPWYRNKYSKIADILAPVFVRSSIKFVLNKTTAKNLTCYHCMIIKPEHRDKLMHAFLYLNSSMIRVAFEKVRRVYRGGISKLETDALRQMPCIEFKASTPDIEAKVLEKLSSLESVKPEVRLRAIDELLIDYPKNV